jgi:hypothetical protein
VCAGFNSGLGVAGSPYRDESCRCLCAFSCAASATCSRYTVYVAYLYTRRERPPHETGRCTVLPTLHIYNRYRLCLLLVRTKKSPTKSSPTTLPTMYAVLPAFFERRMHRLYLPTCTHDRGLPRGSDNLEYRQMLHPALLALVTDTSMVPICPQD